MAARSLPCSQPLFMAHRKAWSWQKRLAAEVASGKSDGALLFFEHPPTFTTGRRDARGYIHLSDAQLAERGFDLVPTDRGGLVTYHGPGQLVAYPVVKLAAVGCKGAREFVEKLQAVMLRTCKAFEITAEIRAGFPGLFVGADKIGAIGIRVERGVVTHGLALNVAPDLSHYQYITPCGLSEFGVTSFARLGVAATLLEVAEKMADAFETEMHLTCRWVTPHALPACDTEEEKTR